MNPSSLSKRENRFYLCLLLSLLLPYCLYGFRYFPVLDDYIQFWGYPARQDLSYVYLTIGTLSIRPLAHLLDPVFWGNFWPAMGISLFLVTVFLFISAILFSKTLKKFDTGLSPFFFLIYLLCPLGMEGKYWLSASTRIITGLLFSALSLFFLAKFLKEKSSAKFFLLFAGFQLLSCGFYESVTVFSVSAAVLLFFLGFTERQKKVFFLVPLMSVVSLSGMFFYYRIFAELGANTSRAARLNLAEIPSHFADSITQLKEIFSLTGNVLIKGGFSGISVLFSAGIWGIFLLIGLVGISLLLSRFVGSSQAFSLKKVLVFELFGCALFLAPLAPNLLTEDVWLTFRSIFPSLIGLSLMLEPLWATLKRKSLRRILYFLFSLFFLLSTVNEYDTYRRAYQLDQKLLEQVSNQININEESENIRVAVILPEKVKVEQNSYYKDHIKSVFDSDWALTGALREKMESFSIAYACPVLLGDPFDTENFQVVVLEKITE